MHEENKIGNSNQKCKHVCEIMNSKEITYFSFKFKYISEPVFSYFCLSKGVKPLLLLLPEPLFTQVSVVLLK